MVIDRVISKYVWVQWNRLTHCGTCTSEKERGNSNQKAREGRLHPEERGTEKIVHMTNESERGWKWVL